MRASDWAFVLCLFLLTGNGQSINLQEKAKEHRLSTYLYQNQKYLSLRSVLKIIGAQDSWGRIQDRVFFIYRGKEIALGVGSPLIIVSGTTHKMENPPREVEGEILVPLQDFERILTLIEGEMPSFSPLPRETAKKESLVQAVSAPSALDTRPFVIFIDPGHGGKDLGAVGNFGLKEKDVNLDVAKRMRHYLQTKLKKYPNIKILVSREQDVFLSLEERVQRAKEVKADVFFCIHTNSSRWNRLDADGFETFYPRNKQEITVLPAAADGEGEEDESRSESIVLQIVRDLNETSAVDESRILAEYVQERLAQRLNCPDRGAKPRNFYVLKYTPMVSILTEIGFICNPNIEANLRDVEVRQAIGETLALALLDYLQCKNLFNNE
ncbi:MAG: N-acetylmuramoyl-L-alanine amidase [Candidatus Omnitrophica bacterium]|nr:N-acetylmuramoyl-L-alanine amidase [Candidatus Omnitrophota bacterium]MCM8768498.1 N-acetylmuramoyl-L-alanine amidase [Candidatus Omnitrophota bacterium]